MRAVHGAAAIGVLVSVMGLTQSEVRPAVPTPGSVAAGDVTVTITSPVGRIGTPGRIRIVAQVQAADGAAIRTVRFLVDSNLVGTDDDGPPYHVEWVDDNPFERREIVAEATDDRGRLGRHVVELKPFEIVEVTGVTSVLVDAGIYDSRGRFVEGLGPESFMLEENGVPQKVEIVRQEAIPATFALLIDNSQSMSRRMPFVQAAAARVVSYLREVDQVLVVPFTDQPGVITGPTRDRDTITGAIATFEARGGTAILDSLGAMTDRMSRLDGRKSIILVTDGYDEKSRATLSDTLASVRQSGVTVYVVGIGGVAGISLKGERVLRQLAESTGGRAFFPAREDALVDVYDVLATDAQNRYLITYTPTNQRADGKWRQISLASVVPEHVVRARDGYRAPAPAPIRPSLEFTVTDLTSQHLAISRDDIEVVEDGVRQSVEAFQEAVSPISIALVLDTSGSMKRAVDAVIEAARRFVLAMRPQDRLSIVTFSDRPIIAHPLSIDRGWSIEAIDRYRTAGGTALYDAICESIEELRSVPGRRAVVVLTDGRDENAPGTAPGSVRRHADAFRAVQESEAVVFPVGLGGTIDRPGLQQMADVSGGQAFFPQDVSQLSEEYAKVLENLRRRYLVNYTSSNVERDGSWRSVEIRVKVPGAKVGSRQGYFAPDR